MTDNSEDTHKSRHRIAGMLVVALGLVGCAIFMGYPLYQAHNGAENITLMPKFILGSIGAIVIGVVIFFGVTFIADENNIKFTDILILLVVGAIGAAAYYFFESHVESLGYRFPDF